jgi:DNA-directed RNA polymerase sigma subunit (sigma70/sigma32)
MSDSITTWLNSAGRYPVLSKEETIYIARRIQAAEKGSKERAKWVNKLCLHNLRFAANVTRSFVRGGRRLDWNSDKTADFLQVAYMGLRRAAEKYDPTLGYTFTTYANAWVRQALGRYHVDNMSSIRVPDSSAREIFFLEKHGRPRNEKVSKWVEEAARCAHKAYSIGSYDAPVGYGDDAVNLLDVLSDENRMLPSAEDEHTYACRVDTAGIMSSLGIEPKIQDLVMAYIRRGNLDTVMMQQKCFSVTTRKAVRAAIKRIQEHTGAAC